MLRSKGIKISITDDEGVLLDTFYMETESTSVECRTLEPMSGRTEHLCELQIGKASATDTSPLSTL